MKGWSPRPWFRTTIPILPIRPVLPTPILPFLLSATSGASSAYSKLRTDLQALETELQTLAEKSGVTIADLQNLTNDSQAIAQAGFHFDATTLNPVISELAVAVAGGASTSQAQSDFTALFSSNSNVSSTTITNTFNDLVKTITDSGVTTTDLSTVAADEAAIQTDLSNLPHGWIPAGEMWLDQVGATPAAMSIAPAIASPTGGVNTAALATLTATPLTAVTNLPAIIVSPFGAGSLAGALSSVGVVTSPVPTLMPPVVVYPLIAAIPNVTPATATVPTGFSQLQADLQKLQTELQSLAAKSGVTIEDLQNLANDAQAISQAGAFLNPQSLDKVVLELATAVAGGTSTTQARTDFTALFSNDPSVSSTTISAAFSDLTKAIMDSNIQPADLTTVAADQAAIQTDLKNLFPGRNGGSGSRLRYG